MARFNALTNAFNRGIVSELALARTDIDRIALSAAIQSNWRPRTLGSMMLRPGLGYILNTKNDNPALHIPFIFSAADKAILEITDSNMRVIVDDAAITRPTVSTTITNGTFDSDVAGWTDNDESGAASVWATGGYLSMTGTNSTIARRTQALTIAGADQNVAHSIVVVITQGVASIKVGSSSGGDDYLSATSLGEGSHYLVFTPTAGTAYLDVSCATIYTTLINSITMSAAGELNVTTPWAEADLSNIRWEQSADVVYLACQDVHPYKIERRQSNSWSIVKFQPPDGPFRNINATQITLDPDAISGDVQLTASGSFFKSGHVGALFYHDSTGQRVEASASAEDTFTGAIRVSGVSTSRSFTIIRSGTWSATVTLQRSVGGIGSWTDVTTYTTNGSIAYNDELDNSIIYYRVGIKAGDYTSGTASLSLEYASGSITGIIRITSVTSSTVADGIVLKDLGGTDATKDWGEGAWSSLRGFPSSVGLWDGRLWWAGKGSNYASISDEYESHDPEREGDSGPINRSIGFGPVDNIGSLLPLHRLVLCTDGATISVRSTSLDEPVTPTNYNLRRVASFGVANVPPVVIDKKGIVVQSGGTRVHELDLDDKFFDYQTSDLTVLVPEIGEPSIIKVVVQRQPDTRVHCVRSDGTVALLVFDRAENVICWIEDQTDGVVEDALVLPGSIEDAVYYQVKRTINGSTKRYLEKHALESECTGLPVAKHADSFIVYSGSEVTTITGLSHLEGKTVVVWGWNTVTPFTDTYGNTVGKDLGTFTVSSGQITGLSAAVTNACVGLAYTAQYQSSKLAYGARAGTALAQKKKITQLALILRNTHIGGLKFGRDFTHLHSINRQVKGRSVTADTMLASYDHDALGFGDTYDTDSRLCLQAAAPRPATVLACVIGAELHEKV